MYGTLRTNEEKSDSPEENDGQKEQSRRAKHAGGRATQRLDCTSWPWQGAGIVKVQMFRRKASSRNDNCMADVGELKQLQH